MVEGSYTKKAKVEQTQRDPGEKKVRKLDRPLLPRLRSQDQRSGVRQRNAYVPRECGRCAASSATNLENDEREECQDSAVSVGEGVD